jgi:hypothetical protein
VQVSGGDRSTLLKSRGVREGDEAMWAVGNASVSCCACSCRCVSGLGSRRRGVERVGVAGTVECTSGDSQVVGRITSVDGPCGQRAALPVAARVICCAPASRASTNVEEASRASEEARLCSTDSGAAEDRRKCAFTPSRFLKC